MAKQENWELGVDKNKRGNWKLDFQMGTFHQELTLVDATERECWLLYFDALVPCATHYGCEAHIKLRFADVEEDRLDREGTPELMDSFDVLSRLGDAERMLEECNDLFLVRGRNGNILKEIRRRDAESQPVDLDDDPPEPDVVFIEDEWEPEEDEEVQDLEFVDTEYYAAPPPKEKWDLLYSEIDNFDSNWFPKLRDKRLSRRAQGIEKAIRRGTNGKTIFNAIQDALKHNMPRKDAKRLWELYRIEKFLAKKSK